MRNRQFMIAMLVLALAATSSFAAEPRSGFTQGNVELKSAGPLAFGPGGVLFIADPQSSAVFAVDTGDSTNTGASSYKMAKVDDRIAGVEQSRILRFAKQCPWCSFGSSDQHRNRPPDEIEPGALCPAPLDDHTNSNVRERGRVYAAQLRFPFAKEMRPLRFCGG